MKQLITAALLLAFSLAKAATINVACTEAAITNALLTTMQHGDTVQVAAGSCTISNSVVINRNISFNFIGAGSNATTLRGIGTLPVFVITSTSNSQTTISGFNCDGLANSGFFAIGGNVPGTRAVIGPVRITSCQFTNTGNVGVRIGACDAWTLVDHCRFETVPSTNQFNCVQFYGNEYYDWTAGNNPLGTTNQSYIEDCYFVNHAGNSGNGFYDGYSGGSATVRHSTFDGEANTGVHGYDSQTTSFRSLEVYNCVFTNVDTTCSLIRGGISLFFSNKVYSIHQSSDTATLQNIGPVLQYYRATDLPGGHGFGIVGYTTTNAFQTNWVSNQTIQIGAQPVYFFTTNLAPFNGNSSRFVLLGATLKESLTNLTDCINGNLLTAGTAYSYFTTNAWPLGAISDDFTAYLDGTTNLYTVNRMDGTNQFSTSPALFGWPAAMQPGVLGLIQKTNIGQTLYGCFSWTNTVYATNGTTYNPHFQLWNPTNDINVTINNVTNLLHSGRDFFDDTIATNYTPLTYPHPWASSAPIGPINLKQLNVGTWNQP